jgi:hypothetical protein
MKQNEQIMVAELFQHDVDIENSAAITTESNSTVHPKANDNTQVADRCCARGTQMVSTKLLNK